MSISLLFSHLSTRRLDCSHCIINYWYLSAWNYKTAEFGCKTPLIRKNWPLYRVFMTNSLNYTAGSKNYNITSNWWLINVGVVVLLRYRLSQHPLSVWMLISEQDLHSGISPHSFLGWNLSRWRTDRLQDVVLIAPRANPSLSLIYLIYLFMRNQQNKNPPF